MEFLEKLLEIQNVELLRNIAKDKFSDEDDIREFINKYNKKNYKKFIVKHKEKNTLENYDKIINALLKKNN